MSNPLHLYDNFTRTLRPFEPLDSGGEVGLYTCGPTVYDYQHIGNFRTFLFEDVLKRVLEWNGYAVRHVMNITDVGHMTDDTSPDSTGEDRMQVAVLQVQRHEHRGVDAAVHVERGRRLGVEEDGAQPLRDLSARA